MLRSIIETIGSWRQERKAIMELSSMTDRDLNDMGISRCDIPYLVRQKRVEKYGR